MHPGAATSWAWHLIIKLVPTQSTASTAESCSCTTTKGQHFSRASILTLMQQGPRTLNDQSYSISAHEAIPVEYTANLSAAKQQKQAKSAGNRDFGDTLKLQ